MVRAASANAKENNPSLVDEPTPDRTPPKVTVRSSLVLYLDLLLAALYLLLLSPRLTGLPWHEVLGLVFTVPLLAHLLIARRWTRLAAKAVAHSRRTRINLALNIALFVLIVIEIFSGLQISQVALPSFGFAKINDRAWRALHNGTLNWIHLLIGLHVAMNWGWIVAAWRRMTAGATGEAKRSLIAPTWVVASSWMVLVVMASALIATVAYADLGPPNLSRLYRQNEVLRFTPTLGHGVLQISGEAFLMVLFAYIGRRWLRLRL